MSEKKLPIRAQVTNCFLLIYTRKTLSVCKGATWVTFILTLEAGADVLICSLQKLHGVDYKSYCCGSQINQICCFTFPSVDTTERDQITLPLFYKARVNKINARVVYIFNSVFNRHSIVKDIYKQCIYSRQIIICLYFHKIISEFN